VTLLLKATLKNAVDDDDDDDDDVREVIRNCQWRRSVLNLGGPGLRPPLSLRQSSFSFPLVDSASWVWAEPAHPLPNILMQFMQSNSLIKITWMFNVLPGTEISG